VTRVSKVVHGICIYSFSWFLWFVKCVARRTTLVAYQFCRCSGSWHTVDTSTCTAGVTRLIHLWRGWLSPRKERFCIYEIRTGKDARDLDAWIEAHSCRCSNNAYTLQYTASHCITEQHTASHFNALQHSAIRCNTVQYAATHCITLHHTASHCVTLHHTAMHCITLQHTATHCYPLQRTASLCNTLHHTATHCSPIYNQKSPTCTQQRPVHTQNSPKSESKSSWTICNLYLSNISYHSLSSLHQMRLSPASSLFLTLAHTLDSYTNICMYVCIYVYI